MTDAPPPAERPHAGVRSSWQRAELVAIEVLTPTIRSVRLRPAQWTPFLAGQHVDIRLTADDGYAAQRSYSVASAPDDAGTLELVIERLEGGEVSSYFHEGAAPGDVLELRGPFAEHFVWRPESSGAVLLAAGGSGVAPFLSMIRQHAGVDRPSPMLLLYSARTWDDVIAREELLERARVQPGFSLTLCLTRGEARRPGDFARRVDGAIIRKVLSELDTPPVETFVCGANRFVGAVSDLLLLAGIPATTIRTERYGGS